MYDQRLAEVTAVDKEAIWI